MMLFPVLLSAVLVLIAVVGAIACKRALIIDMVFVPILIQGDTARLIEEEKIHAKCFVHLHSATTRAWLPQ